MIRPIAVEPRDGYCIWVRYSDGIEGEIDLSDMAGRGVFAAWNDRAFFEIVRVADGGAIAWGDDLDICSDALYMELTGKPVDEVMSGAQVAIENA